MRYTFVRQHDSTDCAAACLAMICLHYKKETTITKLRDMMGTDLKGTNLIGLSKCAEELGFMTQAVRVDRKAFRSKFSLPAIANVITKDGLSHFVVIFKITDKYVIIGDPAKDLLKVEIKKFFKDFTGAMLLMIPTADFSKGRIKGEKIFDRFVRLLLPHKKLFFFSILASLILTVLGIISSLFNKILMDEILPYKLENTLVLVLIIFSAVSVTQAVVGFLRSWIMVFLSQKIDIPLILGYFDHIYKLPMKFFFYKKNRRYHNEIFGCIYNKRYFYKHSINSNYGYFFSFNNWCNFI